MNQEAVKKQLEATRGLLATLDAQIESVLFLLGGNATNQMDDKCDHPKESRTNLTTMGGPETWECRECGYTYNESEVDE